MREFSGTINDLVGNGNGYLLDYTYGGGYGHGYGGQFAASDGSGWGDGPSTVNNYDTYYRLLDYYPYQLIQYWQ